MKRSDHAGVTRPNTKLYLSHSQKRLSTSMTKLRLMVLEIDASVGLSSLVEGRVRLARRFASPPFWSYYKNKSSSRLKEAAIGNTSPRSTLNTVCWLVYKLTLLA